MSTPTMVIAGGEAWALPCRSSAARRSLWAVAPRRALFAAAALLYAAAAAFTWRTHPPLVTPPGGESVVVAGQGQVSFWIRNPTDAELVLALSCSPSGVVTRCATTPSLRLAPRGHARILVRLSAARSGSGGVRLRATATQHGWRSSGFQAVAASVGGGIPGERRLAARTR